MKQKERLIEQERLKIEQKEFNSKWAIKTKQTRRQQSTDMNKTIMQKENQ